MNKTRLIALICLICIGLCTPLRAYAQDMSPTVIYLEEEAPIHLAIENTNFEEALEKKNNKEIKKYLNTFMFEDVKLIGGVRFGYEGAKNYDCNNQFLVPAAQLGFTAKVTENYNFVFKTDFANLFEDDSAFLLNAFAYRDITKNSKFYLGRYRLPLGVDGSASTFALPLTIRSLMASNIGNSRGLGAKIVTEKKYMTTNFGVYDGSRMKSLDFDKNLDFSSWVDFKPLANYESAGELTIGTGVTVGKNDFAYKTYGGYVSYEKNKIKLETEYAYSDGYNASESSENIVDSIYTTAYYKLDDKWMLIARYDTFDPNKYVAYDNQKQYVAGILYKPNDTISYRLNFVASKNPSCPRAKRIIFRTYITPFH